MHLFKVDQYQMHALRDMFSRFIARKLFFQERYGALWSTRYFWQKRTFGTLGIFEVCLKNNLPLFTHLSSFQTTLIFSFLKGVIVV